MTMTDILNTWTPVIAIGGLALVMTLERWFPYFEHGAGRTRQRWHNVGLIAIAFAINALAGSFLAVPIMWADANQFGLMYRLDIPTAAAIVTGIFVLDCCFYVQHRIMHRVPMLWRIHRVHHSDTDLDASSSLRTHPFDLALLISMPSLLMPLAGIPMLALALYNVVSLPWFLLNHSNMKFPVWFERWGSLLMATPDFHRVHHSSHQPETDSHYGCLFSIWDRIFGTARGAHVPRIQFGLEHFREPADQTAWQLLKMPFR